MSEIKEELERMAREQAIYPDWEPNAGDVIAGEVIVRKTIERTDGTTNEVIVVVPEDGSEARTIWESAVLKKLFGEVKIGDRVGIKYLGMQESKKTKGRMYKNYIWTLKKKE